MQRTGSSAVHQLNNGRWQRQRRPAAERGCNGTSKNEGGEASICKETYVVNEAHRDAVTASCKCQATTSGLLVHPVMSNIKKMQPHLTDDLVLPTCVQLRRLTVGNGGNAGNFRWSIRGNFREQNKSHY